MSFNREAFDKRVSDRDQHFIPLTDEDWAACKDQTKLEFESMGLQPPPATDSRLTYGQCWLEMWSQEVIQPLLEAERPFELKIKLEEFRTECVLRGLTAEWVSEYTEMEQNHHGFFKEMERDNKRQELVELSELPLWPAMEDLCKEPASPAMVLSKGLYTVYSLRKVAENLEYGELTREKIRLHLRKPGGGMFAESSLDKYVALNNPK